MKFIIATLVCATIAIGSLLLFPPMKKTQAQGTSQLLKWNDGPDKPVISIQGTDKIGKCSNGTLQTGHTESKGMDDYRWVWDDCPGIKASCVDPSLDPKTMCSKPKVLDFNNMTSGTYACDKDTCKESSGTFSLSPLNHQVIIDGDTVTITGKIQFEPPKK